MMVIFHRELIVSLKLGSRGADVENLQRALGIAADGIFGTATHAAVTAFQASAGLLVDGIAGPATLGALIGRNRRLQHSDITVAAAALGVPVATVQAVMDVEARGRGFLNDGRPVILFERHVFHRRLTAAGRDADDLVRYLHEIVNPQPGGYRVGAAEHDRLYTARQIHPDIAIESASWGLFQIMGMHWSRLGYASAAEFERQMTIGEAEQLDAFVRFIGANPKLQGTLVAHDWAAFAAGYNGPNYRINKYDTKLADAYARHTKGT